MKNSGQWLIVALLFISGCKPGCVSVLPSPIIPGAGATPAPTSVTPAPPPTPVTNPEPEREPIQAIKDLLPDLIDETDKLLEKAELKLAEIEGKIEAQRGSRKMTTMIFPETSKQSFDALLKEDRQYENKLFEDYANKTADKDELKVKGLAVQHAILRTFGYKKELPAKSNDEIKNLISEYESAGGVDAQIQAFIYIHKSHTHDDPVNYLNSFPYMEGLKEYAQENHILWYFFLKNKYYKDKLNKVVSESSKKNLDDLLDALESMIVKYSKDVNDTRKLNWSLCRYIEFYDDEKPKVLLKLARSSEISDLIKCHLMALFWKDTGWDYRGGGYADTVTEQGWKKFHECLERSRILLYYAWDQYPEAPQSPTLLIIMSMAGADKLATEQFWFNESLSRSLDYDFAYTNMLQAMGDNWGGSFNDRFKIYEYLVCRPNLTLESSQPLIKLIMSEIINHNIETVEPLEYPMKNYLIKLGKTMHFNMSTAMIEGIELSEFNHELHILFGIFFESCHMHKEASEVFKLQESRLKKYEYRFWRVGTNYSYCLGKMRAMLSEHAKEFEEIEKFLITLPRFINTVHFDPYFKKLELLRAKFDDSCVHFYCDDLKESLGNKKYFYEGVTIHSINKIEAPGYSKTARSITMKDSKHGFQTLHLETLLKECNTGIRYRYQYPAPFLTNVYLKRDNGPLFINHVGIYAGHWYSRNHNNIETHGVIMDTGRFGAGYRNYTNIDERGNWISWSPSDSNDYFSIGMALWPNKVGVYCNSYCTQSIDIPEKEFSGYITCGEIKSMGFLESYEYFKFELSRLDAFPVLNKNQLELLAEFGEPLNANWEKDPYYRYLLGCKALTESKKKEALDHLNVVVEIVPTYYFAHSLIAYIYYEQQNYPKAFESLKLALNDDGHPEILNLAAWMLSTCPDKQYRNSLAALNYSTKACKIMEPAPSNYLVNYATSLADNEMYDQALEQIKLAKQNAPENMQGMIKRLEEQIQKKEIINYKGPEASEKSEKNSEEPKPAVNSTEKSSK